MNTNYSYGKAYGNTRLFRKKHTVSGTQSLAIWTGCNPSPAAPAYALQEASPGDFL